MNNLGSNNTFIGNSVGSQNRGNLMFLEVITQVVVIEEVTIPSLAINRGLETPQGIKM